MTSFLLEDHHSTLILASDGLWDELDEKQMHRITAGSHGKSGITDLLFSAAFENIKARNKMSKEELEASK